MGGIESEPWRRFNLSRRKALSPVIASVILSGMVLAIGGMVWSYSYGAASTMANDYADETIDMVHTIIERFIIEKVYYDSSTETIDVWVYNYGSIEVTVESTITINGNEYSGEETEITSQEVAEISIDVSAESGLSSYQEVVVEIRSIRDNQEFVTYYVP